LYIYISQKTRKLYSTKIVKIVKNTANMTAVLVNKLVKDTLRELFSEEPETFKKLLRDAHAGNFMPPIIFYTKKI
jgi:hypothetical protein